MTFGQSRRQFDRSIGSRNRLRIKRLQLAGLRIFGGDCGKRPGASGIGQCELRVACDRRLEMPERGAIIGFILGEVEEGTALQKMLIGRDVACPAGCGFVGRDLNRHGGGNRPRDLALDCENVCHLPVEAS